MSVSVSVRVCERIRIVFLLLCFLRCCCFSLTHAVVYHRSPVCQSVHIVAYSLCFPFLFPLWTDSLSRLSFCSLFFFFFFPPASLSRNSVSISSLCCVLLSRFFTLFLLFLPFWRVQQRLQRSSSSVVCICVKGKDLVA